MKTVMQVSDYIDIDALQSILNQFGLATGLAAVGVDYRGSPITEYACFSPFCSNLRKYDRGRELCHECDAHGGLQAAIMLKPYIYKCHAGLVDFAVPIVVHDTYIGALLCGQVRFPPEDEDKLSYIVDRRFEWSGDEELSEYYKNIRQIPYNTLLASANMLYEIANYVVQTQIIKTDREELNQKQMMLIAETHKRVELEKSVREMEWKTLHLNINPHFLFNALNTIGRLAFIENAPRTEEIIYAFAEIMRYTLKRSSTNMVSLAEEVGYVDNYMKIQSIRFGERLNYTVNIHPDLLGLQCPFNTIQPFLENSIKYVIEKKASGGHIGLAAHTAGSNLVIEISDDGDGIESDRISRILNGDEYLSQSENGIGMYTVSKRLYQLYNGEASLRIQSVDDGYQGTMVIISLPLKMR